MGHNFLLMKKNRNSMQKNVAKTGIIRYNNIVKASALLIIMKESRGGNDGFIP